MRHSKQHYVGGTIVVGGFFFLMGPFGLVAQLITGDTIDVAGNRWSDRTVIAKLFFTFTSWAILTIVVVIFYVFWQEVIVPWSNGEKVGRKRRTKQERIWEELVGRMSSGIPAYALKLPHTDVCLELNSNHYNSQDLDGCDCMCHKVKDVDST